jgi:hypothetical protein
MPRPLLSVVIVPADAKRRHASGAKLALNPVRPPLKRSLRHVAIAISLDALIIAASRLYMLQYEVALTFPVTEWLFRTQMGVTLKPIRICAHAVE